jgi:hypothetical protein
MSGEASLERAIDLIRELSEGVGPRRPCSEAERRAAEVLAHAARVHGLEARIEPFRGYASFAQPYGLLSAAALAAGLLQGRGRRGGALLAAAATAGMLLETDLRVTPVSWLLARRPSANVTATVPAGEDERRRVCLCGHMDTTRSGAMFAPALLPYLRMLTAIPAVSGALLALQPAYRLKWGSNGIRRIAIAGQAFSLCMLAEREWRGEDVAGANDNASGAAVALTLAAECAARPLRHTRVDLLINGCEESGLLGAQAYARGNPDRLRDTMFVNFDTVGADVPLTYILSEGTPPHAAAPRLVALLEEIAADRPEIGLAPAKGTPGLPTDATVMMAGGAEAVTLLAQGRTVPNYHQTTDTFANLHAATVNHALETGRELLQRLDAGCAQER